VTLLSEPSLAFWNWLAAEKPEKVLGGLIYVLRASLLEPLPLFRDTVEVTLSVSTGAPHALSVSVREMVEFVLRTGNLGGERDFFSPSRALEGTRGHQKIQKLRPPGYQAEVRVKHQLQQPEFVLTIRGRIDGVLQTADSLLIEEIKTVLGGWNKTADPLHWAQAKIYAWIYATEHNNPQRIEILLSYLDLDSGASTEFRETFALRALGEFFQSVTSVYLEWASRQHEWMKLRDTTITALTFPHGQYRPGQRTLAVATYRALVNGTKLFAEAPTGIGKTVSVLFPAIKALGEGHIEKIFFLTAKNTGRAIAEQTVAAMRHSGLRLRSITITAKDKICFNDGRPCEIQTCQFATGYYDRLKPALSEALAHDSLNQSALEAVARKHKVCPFALSLDAALWADLIICDYNYFFDPGVSLKRFFAEEGGDYAVLVDEAHNLVDRARDMFSAELTRAEIADLREQFADRVAVCAKPLRKIEKCFTQYRKLAKANRENEALVMREPPAEVLAALRNFLEWATEWLLLNEPADFRAPFLELYFRCRSFLRTAELFDERYATIFETSAHFERLRLFCIDPSQGIQNALRRGKSALFFSATLRPIDYYREVLGGEIGDTALQLESPFPKENLAVLIHHQIRTDFRGRDSSYATVAQAIGALVASRLGNYLIFFPSFKYLEAVRTEFQREHPFVPAISQSASMPETDRQNFMAAFQSDLARPLVGFAVLGGVFGEGIDLVGDRLVGAVVVGVGLPQLCLERDLIRHYFNQKNGRGFEYAYAYPGLNRVIQAAGRVIRSETDRGVALLIDTRFAQAPYRDLLPQWWSITPVRASAQIAERAAKFWTL